MKKLLVIGWLMLLFTAVGALFWYNELIYQLPTPVPANYKPVHNGKFIKVDLSFNSTNDKPVFLHFFNPDCPCSRFNIQHFKLLVKQYDTRVNFAVVVLNNKTYTARQIQDKFDLDIPILFDRAIATTCGVYSTPQAVLLDTRHKLYYRGNYNSSRYCADEKTSYAKIAIESLLRNQSSVNISPLAFKAYGCRLPGCSN